MYVESHLQVVVVEVFEQALVVGEKFAVPRPSGPASTVLVGVVPVHVEYKDIERESIVAETINKLA